MTLSLPLSTASAGPLVLSTETSVAQVELAVDSSTPKSRALSEVTLPRRLLSPPDTQTPTVAEFEASTSKTVLLLPLSCTATAALCARTPPMEMPLVPVSTIIACTLALSTTSTPRTLKPEKACVP